MKGELLIELIPAIDLRGGHCVRLYQGDYQKETVFSEDPVEVALRWQSMGAPRIHIVDLDGAASGGLSNLGVIKEIASSVLIPTELGGGIRDLATVEMLLKAGVDRVILGTVAVEDPEMVQAACRKYHESIVVGIDARNEYVATRGWLEQTQIKATDFAKSLIKLGVERFIYTDINRDGTLTEPNFSAIFEMVKTVKVPVIAAGGVTSLQHLKLLKEMGVEGAIIGKALYTGDIVLKKALEVINS